MADFMAERLSAFLGFSTRCATSNYHKLATRRDPAHVHKALGTLALFNFATKAACLVRGVPMRALDGWLVVHVALLATGYGFRVPQNPLVLTHGYISEESRAHTLTFSLRSLALILAAELVVDAQWTAAVRALLCLPFHLAADMATARLGDPGVSSIRGGRNARSHPPRVVVARVLSAMQFISNHALLFCCEGGGDDGAAPGDAVGAGGAGVPAAFAWLAWCQINAFLLTLHRKQLLSDLGLACAYFALSLAVAAACLAHAARPSVSVATGVLLLVLRAQGINKYALWLGSLAVGSLMT
jgi:hypothetical protein